MNLVALGRCPQTFDHVEVILFIFRLLRVLILIFIPFSVRVCSPDSLHQGMVFIKHPALDSVHINKRTHIPAQTHRHIIRP